jgi:hypothetical protein
MKKGRIEKSVFFYIESTMSKLKLYRELIDLRDDFDSAVNCIIDPFLEKKHQVVTMSIASNMS